LLTYIYGVSGALIIGKIFTDYMCSHGVYESTKVAIFGAVIFCPVFLLATVFIAEKLFGAKKSSWRDDMDLIAPGVFIILTCAKFGCFINGCCKGIECSFGITYIGSDVKNFPIQIFEVCTMSLILIIAYFYTFRSGRFIRGTAYPFTAAVYSVSRFCWEYLRYYPDEEARHIIMGLTFWQFCCVLVFVSSVICFIVLKNYKEKAPQKKEIIHRHK
ncbi:MAG: prolipoprotein diacylglyceryl transferase, partial [Clostridia bacterium]|nr:prolipoprotein diacylglyceryl transferase [Clostridia bacterium]